MFIFVYAIIYPFLDTPSFLDLSFLLPEIFIFTFLTEQARC